MRVSGLLLIGALATVNGQCMDVDPQCLTLAAQGECQSNAQFMSVNCKATCGFCGIDPSALNRPVEDEDLGSVPLLYSGMESGPARGEGQSGEVFEPEFIGGDVKIRIYQPLLADVCCWGNTIHIRYELQGSVQVPEDGLVVILFQGQEADIMPYSRGEFQAHVTSPGTYSIVVAVDNHERSQRFAVESRTLEVLGDSYSEETQLFHDNGTLAFDKGLRHTLRRSSRCSVNCVGAEVMEELRERAAEQVEAEAQDQGVIPFVVQVGACDGEVYDPIQSFVKRLRWHGLLVEPLSDLFERLKATYEGFEGLQFSNTAVTDPGQACEMIRVPPELVDSGDVPDWALGVSSFFDDRTAVGGVGAEKADYELYAAKLVRQQVACLTLKELLADHSVSRIDYFQVDAEAYDARILSQLDLESWQPSVIAIETINLQPKELWDSYLRLSDTPPQNSKA